MKVPQVHDLLESFTNLKNVLNIVKYVIIHYNIELINYRSCTLDFCLHHKKIHQ
jgi:hypothetical protein